MYLSVGLWIGVIRKMSPGIKRSGASGREQGFPLLGQRPQYVTAKHHSIVVLFSSCVEMCIGSFQSKNYIFPGDLVNGVFGVRVFDSSTLRV